ncbi:hypothetical protein [Arabiibacter massiliensis]|uniref:hypothetical protein n=1 Tax=Arabiibacter massiliensis TaxID=1870985 RepID=UPI00117BB00A|nr:hypothetical protein [Arabiibacter massiliensis]
MKKRIVAIACAAALMLAMPTLAWAAPSPSGNTVKDSNGVSATVKAESGTIEGIQVSPKAASNAQGNVIASFEVKGDATNVTMTFNVGAKYAGYAYTVYIQHNDGTTEAKSGTVAADGTITVNVDKLSIFSIAIGDKVADSSASNTGAKSPQTGVDFGMVAGATAVAAVAAGVVFVALRKKVTE